MINEYKLKEQICEIGRRVYNKGFAAANDGNITVRLSDREFLCTPTMVSKGFLKPDDICKVDAEGKQLAGKKRRTSEVLLHLAVYKHRPDVHAVVHAHPPTATGFAVAGIPLTRAVLAEVVTTLGSIPIAEYGTPSTEELPEAVRKYIKAHDGLLLANHGAVTCGADVMSAYYKMETIEHFAKISLVARLLGGENLLSRGEVTRLQGLRGVYGTPAPAPLCDDPADATAGDQVLCQVLEAPESSTGRLVPDMSSTLPSTLIRDPELRRGVLQASRDGEIRLTYRQLTDLIADAVRHLRD